MFTLPGQGTLPHTHTHTHSLSLISNHYCHLCISRANSKASSWINRVDLKNPSPSVNSWKINTKFQIKKKKKNLFSFLFRERFVLYILQHDLRHPSLKALSWLSRRGVCSVPDLQWLIKEVPSLFSVCQSHGVRFAPCGPAGSTCPACLQRSYARSQRSYLLMPLICYLSCALWQNVWCCIVQSAIPFWVGTGRVL
jgi:hypothetical protein